MDRLPPDTRRDFLRAGSLSLFGLGLPTLLKAAEPTATPPKKRAKACILLFMWGGPAQQDTWDMKPDAADVYRGEFKPIQTTVPGLQICEHLPQLAKRAHDLCLIRSMTHTDVNHLTATHHLLTGKPAPAGPIADDWPNYGSVLAKLGHGRGQLPPYVSMMPVVPNGAPRFVEQSHGQGAGWLGPVYNPMRIDTDASSPDYRVGEFALSEDTPADRVLGRERLLQAFDRPGPMTKYQPELEAMGAHYRRAFSLLSAPQVTKAFDLSRESQKTRERYGMNRHGQSVLQARRLVEAGVPLVTVFWPNDGITNVSVYWDTHNRNFVDLKTRLCPVTDQATSALLDDLKSRDMLDETLVVWTGEMGRTPKVGQAVEGGAGAGKDGRDHWGKVFTTVLAGGGVAGGAVYGASDRFAAEPTANPTTPSDLAATIYHLLGVDPRTELRDRLNRPLTLCEGQVISGILK
ncbi:MAG: DUF1501 domain-containing protein [Planctomycetes bacterium]|nr:DUF1501 domain-containing protein [Planctomycetota bacterium]